MYKVRQKGTTRLLTSIATTRRVALLVGALFSVFGSSWALATNVNQDNQPGPVENLAPALAGVEGIVCQYK